MVHRRLGDFEGRGSPRAWLFGIARRVAFRVRRSQDRRRRKISALRAERRYATPLDDAVAERELSALLLEALDELDDEKRVALTLHVFEDMSGPQVAAALGLKVDTAYSRIKAGRRALKRVLVERGVEADLGRLVRATRKQTRPGPDAKVRVAAMLAAPGLNPFSPAIAGLPWKAIALAASVGVVSVVGMDRLRPPSSVSQRGAPTALVVTSDDAPRTAAVSSPVQAQPSEVRAPALGSPARRHTTTLRGQARHAPPRPRPDPEPSTATDSASVGLRAEVALIEQATTALRRDDASTALSILAEHAKRFPSGQLAGERRAYRAVALCSAGKMHQGRAEARLSRAAKPSRSLAAWLDSACGLSRSPGATR